MSGRRSSAFTDRLEELDELGELPGLTSPPVDSHLDTPAGASPSESVGPAADSRPTPAAHTQQAQPDAERTPRRRGRPPASPAAHPAAHGDQATTSEPAAGLPAGAAFRGVRQTQVRLPPELARWLSNEAHRTGRTLASVVALAAHHHHTELRPAPRPTASDGLDVPRRAASASTPVTLRLHPAQRQLLDEIAAEHDTTRAAVVVAALIARRDSTSAGT